MKKWLLSTALVFGLVSPVLAEGTPPATAEAPAETAKMDISSNTVQLSLMGIMAIGLGLLVSIGKKG